MTGINETSFLRGKNEQHVKKGSTPREGNWGPQRGDEIILGM